MSHLECARLEFHHKTGTFYILENPVSSLFFYHPAIKAPSPLCLATAGVCIGGPFLASALVQDCLRRHGAVHINICLGAVGAPSAKCATCHRSYAYFTIAPPCLALHGVGLQVTLVGTAPFLAELYTTLSAPRRLGEGIWGLQLALVCA